MSMLLNISLLFGGFSHRRYPDLMGGISLIPAPAIMVCGLDMVGKGPLYSMKETKMKLRITC